LRSPNKRLVQVGYHGSLRVAEPHDYGKLNHSTKLLVYQISTSDATRHGAKGWRLLDGSDITECAVLDEMFPGSRGAAHERHFVWEVVYSRVD
jgi:hypothetical protein